MFALIGYICRVTFSRRPSLLQPLLLKGVIKWAVCRIKYHRVCYSSDRGIFTFCEHCPEKWEGSLSGFIWLQYAASPLDAAESFKCEYKSQGSVQPKSAVRQLW